MKSEDAILLMFLLFSYLFGKIGSMDKPDCTCYRNDFTFYLYEKNEQLGIIDTF